MQVNLDKGKGKGGDAQGDELWRIEHLTGSNHNDRLTENDLNNRLEGGDGEDMLDVGAGNDTFEGGDGADEFVFTSDVSRDTITDCSGSMIERQGDQIDLTSANLSPDNSSLPGLILGGYITQVGTDIEVSVASSILTIDDYNMSDLVEGDFRPRFASMSH
ncbi:MAG: hypothetical protein GDA36_13080, partial [Rhodobacteraceae bacterium]|nr:hypothetical protein [Paracoccaceae bacterium]